MGRSRHPKRKTPVTLAQKDSNASSQKLPASASSASTRGVIRKFHVLLKRQQQLQSQDADSLPNSHTRKDELATIEKELESLGGLERYQAMSSIGQSALKGGGSEKVLLTWIKELREEKYAGDSKATALQLLDVGALKPDNYANASFIQPTPIDLHSRHPQITEQDFMLIQSNPILYKEWDVISLSLVLNFVPDAHERGRMLRLANELLRVGGLLFVVLPLPCVQNSRYFTIPHWLALMNTIGFKMLRERWKVGGKVGYWLFEKSSLGYEDKSTSSPHSGMQRTFLKKIVLREGTNRNNFCILL